MEIRGQEFQRWANVVSVTTLSQMQESEGEYFVVSTGTYTDCEFDELMRLLLNANKILEKMIVPASYPAEPITMNIPGWAGDFAQFNDLYKQWQKSRKLTSSIVGDITRNQFYFQIAGMGQRALPFIFSHLEDETKAGKPDHWFPALNAITGVDPVQQKDRGNIHKMALAWLEWGRQEGYVYAEGMGKGVSKSR
jgi:hypothetical protein